MTDLLNEEGPAVSHGAQVLNNTEDQIASVAVLSGPLFELAAAGYELIRLRGKAPAETGWRTAEPLSAEAAAERLVGGGNVGVRLRETQVVIDWDRRSDPDGGALDRLLAEFGLDPYPHVATGGDPGGRHVYLTVPEGTGVINKTGWRPGIDVKTVGGQVVAPGSVHPDTGRPYVFHVDPLDDRVDRAAPSALIEALPKAAVAERPVATGGGELEPEKLAAILELVPVGDFPDNGAWQPFMMACHHVTGGLARQEFVDWSVSGAGFEDHASIVGRRWDSLHADNAGARVSAGTFWQLLNDYDLTSLSNDGAREDFEGVEVEPVEGALAERPERVPGYVFDYNKRFCVAPLGKETYVFRDTLADDDVRVWEPITKPGFIGLYQHEKVAVGKAEKVKMLPKALLWLDHPRRRFAERVVFDPSRRRVKGALNTWRGWACKPRAGDWSLMRRVIREALAGGNAEYEAYILNWLAFGFQHPAELPLVALVFRGGKGVGKGTLGQTVHKIAGNHGLSVSGMSQVSGRFNAHLRQRVFVFADEVFASGNKEAEAILKRLITEPMLTYEAKGVDARNGPNHCHVIMASNEHWVVPVTGDERRFAVFDVAPVFQGDRGFWDDVHRQLGAGGREAMLHDLLERDVRGWHPTQDVPQTDGLIDQKEMGLSPLERWWFGLLSAGQFPNGVAWPETTTLMTSDGKAMMVDDYNLNRERGEPEAGKTGLARRLGGFGLDPHAFDGSKRAWAIKPLTVARADFTAATGLEFDD